MLLILTYSSNTSQHQVVALLSAKLINRVLYAQAILWSKRLTQNSRKNFINVTPTLYSIEDALNLFFYFVFYSIVAYPYSIIILISLHLLYIWYFENTVKFRDFLKNQLFNLLSIIRW